MIAPMSAPPFLDTTHSIKAPISAPPFIGISSNDTTSVATACTKAQRQRQRRNTHRAQGDALVSSSSSSSIRSSSSSSSSRDGTHTGRRHRQPLLLPSRPTLRLLFRGRHTTPCKSGKAACFLRVLLCSILTAHVWLYTFTF